MNRTILVLGAGMVSPPLIRYFLARREYRLVIAAADFSLVERLAGNQRDRVQLVSADARDGSRLRELVQACDVVVSLLPAVYLGGVTRVAIDCGKPLVSTSYTPADIEELDERARRGGTVVINEIGFDPGIDHMAVARALRAIRARGGVVERFASAAGGIPAPDANDNPWGYKFSWNPRAVVLAGRNAARFLRDGEVVAISGDDLLRHHWPCAVEDHGVFEVYPNRDAISYRDAYGLHDAAGLFRGTIRYPGWCDTMRLASRLGFFVTTEERWPEKTWAEVIARRIGHHRGSLLQALADYAGTGVDARAVTRLEWAGFLSDCPLPEADTPLDRFVARLATVMRYEPGERDMAMLQYQIDAQFPDRHREELCGAIVLCGEAWGDTAMSRLVSLPAAIAARLAAEGKIAVAGAVIPTSPEIYEPVLAELAELGITVGERRTSFHPGPPG